MANQTVTTGTIASPLNYDHPSISPLSNGESITINGGVVRIDSDVRWNQQAAVFGDITISSTLGGALLIDGRDVWEIPFSASSGTVPTQITLGANGVVGGTSGATGELLRVWATGSLEPAAAGGAMPATGYIKLRSKTGTFQAGETITMLGGATITASGPGKRSWIHVVGASEKFLTNSGLGLAQFTGDWYELGTTNGLDDQTFQFPVSDRTPAIWIETAPGSNQYEIWLGAADFWVNGGISTDIRGKYFGMTAATGQIIIAQRTGLTAGYKPASGCRVRVPNVILSVALAANYAANSVQTNYPQSYKTTNSGVLSYDKVASNWHPTFDGGGSIQITNSSLHPHNPVMTSKQAVNLSNVGFGCISNQAITGVQINNCFAGVAMTDVVASRPGNNNSNVIVFTSCKDINLTRVTTNTPVSGMVPINYGLSFSYCQNVVLNSCAGVYGPARFSGTVGIEIYNFSYAGRQVGNSVAGETSNAIRIETGSKNIYVDGYGHFGGLANVGPGNAIVYATNSADIEVRNIGSSSAQLNLNNITNHAVSGITVENVVCRRIYVTGDRTQCFNFSTAKNVQIFNFWGDLSNRPVIQGDDMTARNVLFGELDTSNGLFGTHWSDTFNGTSGRLYLFMHPPSVSSADQCVATLDSSAGSAFSNAQSVRLLSLTDTITWTMPYYILGVTGFSGSPNILGTNTGNFLLEFQRDINDGNGFGAWQILNAANLSAITVNPALGVKLKIRVTVTVANSANLLGTIYIPFVTNATAIATQYPLPVTLNVAEVINIVAGSRLRVYNVTTATEITNQVIAGTSWSLGYVEGSSFTEGDTIQIRVRKPGYLPYQATAVAGETGWALFVSQTADDIYSATTPLNVTIDYGNLKIRATGARASFSAIELVDIIRAGEATIDGIRLQRFAEITGLVELSTGIFTAITVELLGWQVSWAAGSVSQATLSGGNIVGGIAGDPVEDVVGGPQITVQQSADATVVAVGSGVLPGDITAIAAAVRAELTVEMNRIDVAVSSRLAAASYTAAPSAVANASAVRSELTLELGRIDAAVSSRLAAASYTAAPSAAANATAVLAAAQTTPIQADIRKVNNITVDGAGTEADPFGPA